jgi:5-bromo-4-chloroindolyl phosphate hydrolysis protein
MTAILITTGMFGFGVFTVLTNSVSLQLKLIVIGMAVVMPILSITALTSRYTVTRLGLSTKSIWRSRQIKWSELKSIRLVPTYFQAFNIQIVVNNNQYSTSKVH